MHGDSSAAFFIPKKGSLSVDLFIFMLQGEGEGIAFFLLMLFLLLTENVGAKQAHQLSSEQQKVGHERWVNSSYLHSLRKQGAVDCGSHHSTCRFSFRRSFLFFYS